MSEHAEVNIFCIHVPLITTFGFRTLKRTNLFSVHFSTSADVDLTVRSLLSCILL
jgi:hypothetical protein